MPGIQAVLKRWHRLSGAFLACKSLAKHVNLGLLLLQMGIMCPLAIPHGYSALASALTRCA